MKPRPTAPEEGRVHIAPPRQFRHGTHTDRAPPGSSTFGFRDKVRTASLRPSRHTQHTYRVPEGCSFTCGPSGRIRITSRPHAYVDCLLTRIVPTGSSTDGPRANVRIPPPRPWRYTPDLDREFGASWVLLGATRRVSVKPLEALKWIVNRGPPAGWATCRVCRAIC